MENKLLENMQELLTVLDEYHIKPLFVFDGKPPPEKAAVMVHRKGEKQRAIVVRSDIVQKLQRDDICQATKDTMMVEYNRLKRRSVTITRSMIQNVKDLLVKAGVTYYNAPNEADELCASLVLGKKCWACMSDDMDMFVYGCNYVIRDVDIVNRTAVLYDLQQILADLNITYDNFKRVCIISGTDYNNDSIVDVVPVPVGVNVPSQILPNSSQACINLYSALKLYKRFNKNVKYRDMMFYDWLKYYLKYDINYEALHKIYNMFTLTRRQINYVDTCRVGLYTGQSLPISV